MIEAIKVILQTCDSESPVVPPTMLFNEGWCLRIILNWFSNNEIREHPLNFDYDSVWYSEGLLRSPFLPRYRGDPLSESWTHADGVIGNFTIKDKNTSELELLSTVRRFVVLEAKIFSSLSKGVSHASYYDQAARYIACIAELIRCVNLRPRNIAHLSFHVLAPESQIRANVFGTNLNRESIYQKVERRTEEYGGEKKAWFNEWFKPTLDAIVISAISWEEILESIANSDPFSADQIKSFYNKCLEYNQINKTA